MPKRNIAELCYPVPQDVATTYLIEKLFGPTYMSGTFILGERKSSPGFLLQSEQPCSYEQWISNIVRDNIRAIKFAGYFNMFHEYLLCDELSELVLQVLGSKLQNGIALEYAISNQESSEIIWRIMRVLLNRDRDEGFPIYKEFNKYGKFMALNILSALDEFTMGMGKQEEGMFKMRLSIIAGLIGLNVKESFIGFGPSPLNKKAVIGIDLNDMAIDQTKLVLSQILGAMKRSIMIDSWPQFYDEVVCTDVSLKIAYITDDYIEGIFDLVFIQWLLTVNEHISLVVIPRDGCYGNDISWDNILDLLKEPAFESLNSMINSGRFSVCKNGPRMGAFCHRETTIEAFSQLDGAEIIVAKGARTFEMLYGIKKVVYFCFNVVRSFTESLTGLDSDEGQQVFFRKALNVIPFENFHARKYRRFVTDTGKEIHVCGKTVKEVFERC